MDFITNLISFDGGRVPPAEAKQIAADVSKYLAFANQTKCNWKHLTNIDKLYKYVDMLRTTSKIGPNGTVTKIHRLQQAAAYLRRTGLEDVPASVTARLESWKSSFTKDKTTINLSRAIEQDTSPVVLSKIRELFSNQQLQEELEDIKDSIREDALLGRSQHSNLSLSETGVQKLAKARFRHKPDPQ